MRTCCKRFSAGCSSHRRQQLKARVPRRSVAVATARRCTRCPPNYRRNSVSLPIFGRPSVFTGQRENRHRIFPFRAGVIRGAIPLGPPGPELPRVKRHIVVDSLGLLLAVMVTATSADDGTAAPDLLARLTAATPASGWKLCGATRSTATTPSPPGWRGPAAYEWRSSSGRRGRSASPRCRSIGWRSRRSPG